MGFVIEGTILKRYTEEPGVYKVEIPNGITKIAPMAFSFSNNIQEIIIPDSVIQIGYECFHCKALEKIYIPDSVVEIQDWAFGNCSSLTEIRLPLSLRKIEDTLFSKCTSLKRIEIPESVTEIGYFAFSGCKVLEEIKLPKHLSSIGPYAFAGCKKLKIINLPENITIKEGTFSGCKALSKKAEFFIVQNRLFVYNGAGGNVVIPEGVTSIESDVFKANKKISEVYIPDTVTAIPFEEFKNCRNLKKIKLSAKMKEIPDNLFWDCRSLEEVIVPEGIRKIGASAFRHCYALKKIILPKSLTKIEEKAFSGTIDTGAYEATTKIVAPGCMLDEIASPEDKFAAVLGFLDDPDVFTDENILTGYNMYLHKRLPYIISMILKSEDVKAIIGLVKCGVLTNDNLDQFLDEAVKEHAVSVSAFLLDFIHNRKESIEMNNAAVMPDEFTL